MEETLSDKEIMSISRPPRRTRIIPAVYNSPHSGDDFPPDFDFAQAKDTVREGSDLFVDKLFADAPKTGATLVSALFPRSYIDLNRAVTDIDSQLLAEKWDGKIKPTERSRSGIGLVRRLCKAGVPLYSRYLTNQEIHHRIDNYYIPYHERFAAVLDGFHDDFGGVWHIECHSTPSHAKGNGNNPIRRRYADFILGDRDGTTCSSELRYLIRDVLIECGYSVRINDPYKGVEMVKRYGKPQENRHSIQIEINKDLYMDEEKLCLTPGFEKLKNSMDFMMERVAQYVSENIKYTEQVL